MTMKITHVKTALKWVGLYLLANLVGGLVDAVTGRAVNGSVAAAIIFACTILFAWKRRERRLREAREVGR